MTEASPSLITIDEAEEVIENKMGPFSAIRTPLMIVLGLTIIATATILIMILISLRGSRTGIEAALPFLDKKTVQTLQEPGQ